MRLATEHLRAVPEFGSREERESVTCWPSPLLDEQPDPGRCRGSVVARHGPRRRPYIDLTTPDPNPPLKLSQTELLGHEDPVRARIAFGGSDPVTGLCHYSLQADVGPTSRTRCCKNTKISCSTTWATPVRTVQRVMRNVVILDDAEAKKAEMARSTRREPPVTRRPTSSTPCRLTTKPARSQRQDQGRPGGGVAEQQGDGPRHGRTREREARSLLFCRVAHARRNKLGNGNHRSQHRTGGETRNAGLRRFAERLPHEARNLPMASTCEHRLAVRAAWLGPPFDHLKLGAEPGVAVKLAQDVAQVT